VWLRGERTEVKEKTEGEKIICRRKKKKRGSNEDKRKKQNI
jgi:hypothetical protein